MTPFESGYCDVLTKLGLDLGPAQEEDTRMLNYLPSSFNNDGLVPHKIEDDEQLRQKLRDWKQGFVRRGIGVTAGLSGLFGLGGAYAGATTAKTHPVLGGIIGAGIGAAGGAIPMGLFTRGLKKERDRAMQLTPEELNSIRRLSAEGGGFEQ